MANLNQTDMLTFAKGFIEERIRALRKDVVHCLTGQLAPIPAISYCFSTINLLGELSIRKRAGNRTDSNYQTETYMQRFMGYNAEQTELLMKVFRHKVAHLAIPNPLYVDGQGRRFAWWYIHQENPAVHLLITREPANSEMEIAPNWKVPYDHIFHLSIGSFVSDIGNSVDDGKGNGYLARLQGDPDLQAILRDGLCEIYQS